MIKKINTKYRKIYTSVPNKQSLKLIKKIKQKEPRGMHGQYPIVWKKAKNFSVFDNLGNKFIDFSSSILVANIGHSNSKIIRNVKKLFEKPLLHTYTYFSQERYDYLKNLLNFTPNYLQKAFLLSSGTETTEAALKIMRYYGNLNKKGANIIISFDGNWHGRTLGAEMMGGKKNLKQWIKSKDKNFVQLPFPYPWSKKNIHKNFFKESINHLAKKRKINFKKDISGIILEAFQGWGTIFYPKNFINEIKNFCYKNKILITFDEIQSGFGRTGKLFGYMHYGIKPDLVCCGKGAGSGFPLSFILGRSKLLDLPKVGEMSSTHSANPLACVIGNATIKEMINKNLIQNSKQKGLILHKELTKIKKKFPKIIKYIFGKGLVASIVFDKKYHKDINSLVDKIANCCFENGLIVIKTNREAIKIAPPLTITETALREGISVIKNSISKYYK